jgi:hypothetical protein
MAVGCCTMLIKHTACEPQTPFGLEWRATAQRRSCSGNVVETACGLPRPHRHIGGVVHPQPFPAPFFSFRKRLRCNRSSPRLTPQSSLREILLLAAERSGLHVLLPELPHLIDLVRNIEGGPEPDQLIVFSVTRQLFINYQFISLSDIIRRVNSVCVALDNAFLLVYFYCTLSSSYRLR